jgi:homoserine dehydrogenase
MVAPLKAGLAGLGTVGSAVVRLLEQHRDVLASRCGRAIEVVAVSAREPGKKRDLGTAKPRFVGDPVALAADRDIDVFVELMGGDGDPARRAVQTALAAGKSVVTANKALLAKHGAALADLAEKHGVALNFEAAVGGAIPIVKTLREGLAGNSFSRIYGILNGTCNYILTRMEQEQLSFAESIPMRCSSKGFPRSHPRTSRPPRNWDIGSSCSGSRCAPERASSSGCIRPWCPRTAPSPRSWA